MKINHYIVHTTYPNSPPQSTYGTSLPVHRALGPAMAEAVTAVRDHKRVFITARDENSNILFLLPVVDYPEINTHVPHFAQRQITDFIQSMDWSS